MRIKAILLIMLATAEVYAQENLLDCVDTDVVKAFLGQQQVISRKMPNEYSELSMPTSFAYVGSAVREQSSSIAYKTGLDAAAAEPEVTTALEAGGWSRVVEPKRRTDRRGFQTTPRMPRTLTFCRGNRYMSGSFRQDASGTVVVMTSQLMGSGSCALTQVLAGRRASDFLPKLDLPPSVPTSSVGGSGGSNDYASSRIRFAWTKDLNALLSFFHGQLVEQGWKHTTEWSTARTAGSVWESNPEDGIRTSGTLEIARDQKTLETSVVFWVNMFEES